MSDKKKKAKKPKQKKENTKRLQVAPVFILDNIVFSKKEVWAYYKIATIPFDFLGPDGQVAQATNTMNAINALCFSSSKSVDCHVLITNEPLNIDAWESQIREIHSQWVTTKNMAFDRFVETQKNDLYNSNYKKRITYLGVKLFQRGAVEMGALNVFEFGVKDSIEALKKVATNFSQMPSEEVTVDEERRAKKEEKEIYRVLSEGFLRTSRPTSEQLLMTIKNAFYPGMETPYLWADHENRIGLNDIVIETDGVIKNKYGYLEFIQDVYGEEQIGYRTTMTFQKFPKGGLDMPYGAPPFLYYPIKSGLPYIISSRFSLLPNEEMKKSLKKQQQDSQDELKNIDGSGQDLSAGAALNLQDLQEFEMELEVNKLAWVSGSYRITIESDDLDDLKDRITNLRQEYAAYEIVLRKTSGDQMELFLEEILGGTNMSKSFVQTTTLSKIGVSGFNFGGQAGDPIWDKPA